MVFLYIQREPWDKVLKISHRGGGHEIKSTDFNVGDYVIFHSSLGTDIGKIIKIETKEESEEKCENILLRKATKEDLLKIKKQNKTKKKDLKICREAIKRHKLAMKVVDAHYSFDGGKIIFAFTSSKKIDFRDLVKDLSKIFHRSVILYQIGARQEAGTEGDIGPCGYPLCCKTFLKKLGNISVDFVKDQQLEHQGLDRLTGYCGRLKCCLQYEEELYKELTKNLPPVGSKVKTPKGIGKVVERHILKQTLVVLLEDGNKFEFSLNEIKII